MAQTGAQAMIRFDIHMTLCSLKNLKVLLQDYLKKKLPVEVHPKAAVVARLIGDPERSGS